MPLLGSRGAASSRGFGSLANLGYFLRSSLRFRASNEAYLSRTPASSTNRTTWTWSAWVKRGDLVFNSDNRLFGAGTSNSNRVLIGFENYIAFVITDGTGNLSVLSTTSVYRDPSAWYHLVVAFDSTQATASNRVKIYVNGSQVTNFSTSTYPPQNTVTPINSTDPHVIGTRGYTLDSFYDGYMAEVNFVDGQALTPSSFGKTDAATGQWIPKKYSGAYGTNGFYLKFDDSSAVGKDSSGNGNNWSTSGHSVTPGVTYDLMTDVPTLTNATTANYATLNPLDSHSGISAAAGNLQCSIGTNDWRTIRSTIQLPSGKWYFEFQRTTNTYAQIGVGTAAASLAEGTGDNANSWCIESNTGNKRVNNVSTSYGSAFNTTDITTMAVDTTGGSGSVKIWWGKNGTWFASGDPAAGTNAAFTNLPSDLFVGLSPYSSTIAANFGQQGFTYTPPSGFKALNTFNLP